MMRVHNPFGGGNKGNIQQSTNTVYTKLDLCSIAHYNIPNIWKRNGFKGPKKMQKKKSENNQLKPSITETGEDSFNAPVIVPY